MKRLALVLVVLALFGTAQAWAADAATTTAEQPVVQDFNPNPYEKQLENAETGLKNAYDALEKLYNSFNFDQLIQAYYAYGRNLAVYNEFKKRFDAFETAYPFKLVVRVRGFDLTTKPEVDYPICPHEVDEKDDAALSGVNPAKVGVQAKLAITSQVGLLKVVKNFDTNAQGYLAVKHFASGQNLAIEATAEGYAPYKTKVVMNGNKKRYINLEVLTASVKGLVSGLPKLPNPTTLPAAFAPGKPAPLAGARLTFVHTATKRTYTTVTLGSRWLLPRLVPVLWQPQVGRYYLARMVAGEYEVTVTKEGYRPFKNKLTLEASLKDAKEQNFVLVPLFDHPLATDQGDGKTTSGTTATSGQSTNFDDPLAQ